MAPPPPRVACVAASLLVVACKFASPGLGSTTDEPPPGTSSTGEPDSGESSGPPVDPTTEPAPGTTGDGDTGEPSSTGPGCAGDCPPEPGWTVVGEEGGGVGYALVCDAAGEVFVAGDRGHKNQLELRSIWAARLAGADGTQLWERTIDGKAHLTDFARAVALAGDGAVVLGGGIQDSEDTRIDVWVGWLDPETGEPRSASSLGVSGWDGAAGTDLDESVRALAVDEAGELVVGGTRCPRPCEVPDAWLGHFNVGGKPTWPDSMLVLSTGFVRAVAVAPGEIAAVGTDGYADSMAPGRTVARRFTLSGASIWSAVPESDPDRGFDARDVAIAGDGRLWVVGQELGPGDAVGGFVRVYTPDSGVPEHELRGADLDGEALTVVLQPDGSAVVGGSFTRDGGAPRLWLAALTPELEPLWRLEEPDASRLRALVRDEAGDLVALGVIEAARPEQDRLWLRKYVAAAQ